MHESMNQMTARQQIGERVRRASQRRVATRAGQDRRARRAGRLPLD